MLKLNFCLKSNRSKVNPSKTSRKKSHCYLKPKQRYKKILRRSKKEFPKTNKWLNSWKSTTLKTLSHSDQHQTLMCYKNYPKEEMKLWERSINLTETHKWSKAKLIRESKESIIWRVIWISLQTEGTKTILRKRSRKIKKKLENLEKKLLNLESIGTLIFNFSPKLFNWRQNTNYLDKKSKKVSKISEFNLELQSILLEPKMIGNYLSNMFQKVRYISWAAKKSKQQFKTWRMKRKMLRKNFKNSTQLTFCLKRTVSSLLTLSCKSRNWMRK